MTDHAAEALARLPEQFRKPRIQAVLSAFASPVQALEDALQALLTERAIDTAIGQQLDDIGAKVGQPRDGLDDETYRRYVRARIATDRSHGQFEDLIAVARAVLVDPDLVVTTSQEQIATVIVRADGVSLVDGLDYTSLAEAALTFLRDAVSAGVRLIFEWSPGIVDDAFTMATAAFLDGPLAGGEASIPVLGGGLEFPGSGTIVVGQGLASEESLAYDTRTDVLFNLSGTVANAHVDATAVVLSTGPGKGLSDTSAPSTGGLFALAGE